MKNAHNPCFVGVYYFTITCLQLIIQISVKKLKLFYVFNGFSWIRIRIIWYGSGFRIQPFFYTDPDPGKWYGFHGYGSATLLHNTFLPLLQLEQIFRQSCHLSSTVTLIHSLDAFKNSNAYFTCMYRVWMVKARSAMWNLCLDTMDTSRSRACR